MTDNQKWEPCALPEIGDTIRWNEPLWAKPNKPRGKRDKIGEQQIVAKLNALEEVVELTVVSVIKLSGGDAAELKVAVGDNIRRKITSINLGNCHKLVV